MLDGSSVITTFAGTASPAKPNYKAVATIVVNELLAHTDPPFEDAVEFYNTSNEDVNIGGWYLSNKAADLKKYRLPDNTIIKANSSGNLKTINPWIKSELFVVIMTTKMGMAKTKMRKTATMPSAKPSCVNGSAGPMGPRRGNR